MRVHILLFETCSNRKVPVIVLSTPCGKFCGQNQTIRCVFSTNQTSVSSPVSVDRRVCCHYKTCFLSTSSPSCLELIPSVCHTAFHRAQQQKLPIMGYEVNGNINTKGWTKWCKTPHETPPNSIVSGLQLQRQLWQIEQNANQQFNLCQLYKRTDDWHL